MRQIEMTVVVRPYASIRHIRLCFFIWQSALHEVHIAQCMEIHCILTHCACYFSTWNIAFDSSAFPVGVHHFEVGEKLWNEISAFGCLIFKGINEMQYDDISALRVKIKAISIWYACLFMLTNNRQTIPRFHYAFVNHSVFLWISPFFV